MAQHQTVDSHYFIRSSFLWSLLIVGTAWGAEAPKISKADRRPVVAYWVMHHNEPPATMPWQESYELPRLVAYEDGLVVMVRPHGVASSITLSSKELLDLVDAAGDSFVGLDKDSYEGTRQFHPPIHVVTRWKDGLRKTVRFFGALDDPLQRDQAPPGLQKALDTLSSFATAAAKPYVPHALKVRACRTTAAPKAKQWPAGWPQPEEGKKESHLDGCFTLTIPGAQRRKAEALLSPGQRFATVPHQGTTWLVTLTRFVLPAEEAWEGR